MYNIGYFSLSRKGDSEEAKGLLEQHYKVHFIKEEHLRSIDHLDVLLLEDLEETDLNRLCGTLMSVRKRSNILIWVLAKPDSHFRKNRMIYLKLGADGVMDHSEDWEELSLVLKNAINRNYSTQLLENPRSRKELVSKGNGPYFKLNHQNLSVLIEGGEEVSLTRQEFTAITYLYENAQKMVSYEELHRNIWNDNGVELKYRVCNLIFHLRRKLQPDKSSIQYIRTIRSRGYILNVK